MAEIERPLVSVSSTTIVVSALSHSMSAVKLSPSELRMGQLNVWKKYLPNLWCLLLLAYGTHSPCMVVLLQLGPGGRSSLLQLRSKNNLAPATSTTSTSGCCNHQNTLSCSVGFLLGPFYPFPPPKCVYMCPCSFAYFPLTSTADCSHGARFHIKRQPYEKILLHFCNISKGLMVSVATFGSHFVHQNQNYSTGGMVDLRKVRVRLQRLMT